MVYHPPNFPSANNLVDYDDDTFTYTLGIGRKFSEAFSGALTLGYESSTGSTQSDLGTTDGFWSVGLGGTYSLEKAKITGGVCYTDLGDAITNNGARFTGNSAWCVGLQMTYALISTSPSKSASFGSHRSLRKVNVPDMTEQKSMSARAWAELFLLALIWGGSFLAIRVALDEVPVITSVLHRTGWAMLVLWGVIFAMRLPIPRAPRIWGAFLVMGLLNNVIPFGLMAWGQLYIETGLTSILNAATAIFGVLVAAAIFADERLTARKIIGVGLGFLGVAVAIGLQNFTTFNIQSIAQIAIIAGTFSYALASAWARAKLGDLPPQVAAAGMLTGSTIVLLPAALLIDGPVSMSLQADTWAAIGYYAIIATAGAYLLYYRVLAMAGSGNLMLVTLVIPPVAIVLGAYVRGETLMPQAYVGFALLAVGLLILNGTIGRPRN